MSNPESTAPFVAGGTVQAGGGSYVERPADAILPRLCREGDFAYVFTPRQMGKSSLMIRTAEKLIEEDIKPVIIDLTEIGASATADQWYRGVLEKLADQLELRTGLAEWWERHGTLSVAQRFNRFLTDVVLLEIPERIVVFVDEIDTTLRLDFTDDFFASIRYLYNARATSKALARLSFVLLGVASPGDLMKDPDRTPFNIGQRVDLDDFTEDEAVRDLGVDRDRVRVVFRYTSGHPYLTLRVFRIDLRAAAYLGHRSAHREFVLRGTRRKGQQPPIRAGHADDTGERSRRSPSSLSRCLEGKGSSRQRGRSCICLAAPFRNRAARGWSVAGPERDLSAGLR